MRVICSWCDRFLREKEPLDNQTKSHTICEICLIDATMERSMTKDLKCVKLGDILPADAQTALLPLLNQIKNELAIRKKDRIKARICECLAPWRKEILDKGADLDYLGYWLGYALTEHKI